MLNQSTDNNPCRSSLALKKRCAMYPPPPGSAPGYQKAHHCSPRFTTNVSAGRVHNNSVLSGLEKSGKNDVASPASGPAAARISARRASRLLIPPQAITAKYATAITMLILSTNWNKSVHRTPHNPPSATYNPVNGIRKKTQTARARLSL